MQESIANLKNFLIELINISTVSPSDNGISSLLCHFLEDLGFSTEIWDFDGVKNVYASITGIDDGPSLLFSGHYDVVPSGDERLWTIPPFRADVINGTLYGRGAVDMKGAIAAFFMAVKRYIYHSNGALKRGRIGVLITGDEEVSSICGIRKAIPHLKEKGIDFDFAIVGEPTSKVNICDNIKIGRRGSISYKLEVAGKQGHVAYPQFAKNPIRDLVRMLDDLNSFELDSGNDYFLPSHCEVTSLSTSERVGNVIPGFASAFFNIRFNDLQTPSSLQEKLHSVFLKHCKSYVLTEELSGSPFLIRPDSKVFLMQQVVQKITGLKPSFGTDGGTSDARFLKDYCPLLEIGLLNATAHQIDENVPLHDLFVLSSVYEEYLRSFFVNI